MVRFFMDQTLNQSNLSFESHFGLSCLFIKNLKAMTNIRCSGRYNFQLESSNVYAFCSSSGFVALASSAFASFPSSSPSFRPILLRNILIVVSLYWLTACYWLKPRTSNFLLSHWRVILWHYSKASGYTVSSLLNWIPWGQLNLHINPV